MTAITLNPAHPGERHRAAGRIPFTQVMTRRGLLVFDRCDVRLRTVRTPATGGG